MMIKGSLYLCARMLKQILAAKNCSVKIGPQNGGFLQNGGLNIIFSHHDPKRHILHQNDVYWRILNKNGVYAEPKKALKTSHVFWEQKPLNRLLQNLRVGCCPWRNHACQFW